MEELEQLNQIIHIDCAPGDPRPDVYLKIVLKDTGIDPVPPKSTFFGDWAFDFSHVDRDLWKKCVPIFKERLTKLYNSGAIRYASW